MVRYLVTRGKTRSGVQKFAVRIPKNITSRIAMQFAKKTKPKGNFGPNLQYKIVSSKSKRLALKRI